MAFGLLAAARRLVVVLCAIGAGVGLALGACGPSDDTQATLCVPGTEIFCKCPGGQASGVATCLAHGDDFGDCEIAPGVACGDRVECDDGDTIPCLCPDNTPGQKACLRDGSGFDDCMLDEITPCPTPQPTVPGVGGSGPSSEGEGGSGGGAGGGPPAACAHPVCEEGDSLVDGCDACVTAVCAVDDYCCTIAWDIYCMATVDAECDMPCTSPDVCAHTPCEAGEALNATCSPCVVEVCETDAWCCDAVEGEWDDLCIDHANDVATHPACDGLCGCEHSECVEGVKLDATCSPCVAAICRADEFCCTNTWDQFCVADAEVSAACECPSG